MNLDIMQLTIIKKSLLRGDERSAEVAAAKIAEAMLSELAPSLALENPVLHAALVKKAAHGFIQCAIRHLKLDDWDMDDGRSAA